MIFVGMNERSSGQIRGIQISEGLKSIGIDARFIDSRDQSLSSIKNQTVIFIRRIDKNIAKKMKNQGCKVVFDTLDRPVADIHECIRSGRIFSWSFYDSPEIDEFIVNNSMVRDQISQISERKCTIIPHHAVDQNPVLRKSVKTAGYIGLADQLDSLREIEEILKNHGIIFSSTNPLTRQECIDDLNSLDLGIIFLKKNERTDPVIKYKPNTKLTNFQSFGIPTISIPYHSFVEFGSDAWVNSSEENFMRDLEEIIVSHNKLEEISSRSIENSRKYSLDRICEIYASIDQK
jgi:hypothetical protein